MEADTSEGGELFKTEQGFPVTFSLSPLSPEREEAQMLIELWGGIVTGQAGGLHTIRLVDSKGSGFANSGSEDVFKLQYIYDCVDALDLLDLKNYRVNPSVYTDEVDVMDILLGNKSWRDAKRLPKDKIGKINRTKDRGDVPVPNSRCKHSYTLEEEKAILQYVIQQCRFDEVKGKALWVDMEQAEVCPGRSWGSMKEHFRMYIVHNIQQFNLRPLFAKKLSESFSPHALKIANIDATANNKETEENNDDHIQSELLSKKKISSSVARICGNEGVDVSAIHINGENTYSDGKDSCSLRRDMHELQQHFSSDGEESNLVRRDIMHEQQQHFSSDGKESISVRRDIMYEQQQQHSSSDGEESSSVRRDMHEQQQHFSSDGKESISVRRDIMHEEQQQHFSSDGEESSSIRRDIMHEQQQHFSSDGEESSSVRRDIMHEQQQHFSSDGEESSSVRRDILHEQQQNFPSDGEESSLVRRDIHEQQQHFSGKESSSLRRGIMHVQQQHFSSDGEESSSVRRDLHEQQQHFSSDGEESSSLRRGIMHEQQQQLFSSDDDVFKRSQHNNADISSPGQLNGFVLQVIKNLHENADKMDCANVSQLTDDIQKSPVKLLHTPRGEQSHGNLYRQKNESTHSLALENHHMELDLRQSRCEVRDIIEDFTDESHSCCGIKKDGEADACNFEKKQKQRSKRERSSSKLCESRNHENYEANKSTNLSVIKSCRSCVVPNGLGITCGLDNSEVGSHKTSHREKCQGELATVNVPFDQGVESESRTPSRHMPNSEENLAIWNLSVEEVETDVSYKGRHSPELFKLEEVIGNKKCRTTEWSKDLYVSPSPKSGCFKATGLKKSEKKNRRQERISMRLTYATDGAVESSPHEDRKNMSDSRVVLESSDEENERIVQVTTKRKNDDSLEISDFSDENECSSRYFADKVNSLRETKPESQRNEKHNSLPSEKDRPFGVIKSRFFLRNVGHSKQRLKNQFEEPEDRKDLIMKLDLSDSDSEMNIQGYPTQGDSSPDIKVVVNDSPSKIKDKKWYTMGEDIALLTFIQNCDGYKRVGGNQLWKEMEKSGILKNRTWHSLKERYRKVIIQQLDVYANVQSVSKALQVLSAKGTSRQVVKKEPDARKPYTCVEDKLILDFIIMKKRYSEVGGKSMWEQMSREPGLEGRTWLSLKERFRRFIAPNLVNYNISDKAERHFSKWLKTKRGQETCKTVKEFP